MARPFPMAQAAGAVVSANTSVKAVDADVKRDLLLIQNPSGETGQLFYNFDAAATSNGTHASLAPGEWIQFDTEGAVPTGAVHVNAANAGHRWVVVTGRQGRMA